MDGISAAFYIEDVVKADKGVIFIPHVDFAFIAQTASVYASLSNLMWEVPLYIRERFMEDFPVFGWRTFFGSALSCSQYFIKRNHEDIAHAIDDYMDKHSLVNELKELL